MKKTILIIFSLLLSIAAEAQIMTELVVDVCQGTTYTIEGKEVVTEGDYFVYLHAQDGQDSIVHYTFNVHPYYDIYNSITLCRGESYDFYGQQITRAGDYAHVLKTIHDCDSTMHLHVDVLDTFHTRIDTTVCGTSFSYNGRTMVSSGTYYDTLQATTTGCDSIIEIRLTLNEPSAITEVNIDVCDGDSVLINDKKIPGKGIYTDTLLTRHGCDSVVRYIFNVHNRFDFYNEATTCANQPYEYHGQTFTGSGDHLVYFRTVYGCDSVYHLRLTVDSTYYDQLDTIVCGTEFRFYNLYLTESGTYDYVSSTPDGCDSIHRINLVLSKPVVVDIPVNFCRGDSLSISGRPIPGPGIYVDSSFTAHGCDSVTRYIVNVRDNFEYFDTAATCSDMPYVYHGDTLNGSGDFNVYFKTMYGCDSTYHLHLTVDSTGYDSQDVTACGYSYQFHTLSLTESGTYYYTESTPGGCKFRHRINLTLIPPVETYVYMESCYGNTVEINGKPIPTSGTYSDTLRTSQYGCDSIVHYIVNYHDRYDYYDTAATCANTRYIFHGDTLTGSGDFTKRFQTVHGCDSVFHIHLTVDSTGFDSRNVTACGNSYQFYTMTLTESGTYDYVETTPEGCAFTHRINLTLIPPVETYVYMESCYGNTVEINGKPIPTSGTYTDTLRTSQHGCDSIVHYVVNYHDRYDYYDTAATCANTPYIFHGDTLTGSGDFAKRFQTVHGCDSVFHIHLTVDSTGFDSRNVTACGNSYQFYTMTLTESGTYDYVETTPEGCAFTHRINLTLIPPVETYVYMESCYGNTVMINGKPIPTSGTYSDTLRTSQYGCDSIVHYIVNYHDRYDYYDTAATCANTPYIFHGDTLTGSGDFTKRFQTVHGCDSVFHIHLTVDSTGFDSKNVTACGNSYQFYTMTLTESGTYDYVETTPEGCSFTHRINLTLEKPKIVDVPYNACSGDSAYISGKWIPATGVYTDSLLTSHGCDSIVRYIFNVHDRFEQYDTGHICRGDTYQFHDTLFTVPGDHIVRFYTAAGCDSVYHLHLYVHDSYMDSTDMTICENDTLYINGQRIQKSGVYRVENTTIWGCDSIQIYNVTVNDTAHKEVTINICSGGHVVIGDTTVSTTGTFVRTMKTTHGCDSIVKYTVNAQPIQETYDTGHICNGDVYLYHDSVYTRAGHYRIVKQTLYGCDSIYNLRLYVHDSNYDSTTVTICENDTLYINGQRIQQSGIYREHYNNQWGCDSVFVYNVTVNDTAYREVTLNICQGSTASLGDTVVTVSGVYYRHLYTTHGCDSTVKYTVNFGTPFEVHDTAHICQGDLYNYHGTEFGADGDHVLNFKTARAGCDSIYHLRLYVHPTYYQERQLTLCRNEYFEVNHRQVVQSGTYYDSTTSIYGCDSITKYEIHINDTAHSYAQLDICRGSTANIGDTTVATSGTYIRTLRTSLGCDSTVTFSVNVHDPTDVYDTLDLCRGDVYTYRNQQITTGGNHIIRATNKWGCDDTYHLHVRMHDTYFRREYRTICQNEYLEVNHRQILTSGTYQDSNRSIYGCDSIIEYIVTVHDTAQHDIVINVCQGSTFTIKGKVVPATGVYKDMRKTSHGCDSVVNYIFIEHSPFHRYDTIHSCQGDSVLYHGKLFLVTGNHTVHDTTAFGCDSDFHLHLEVHDSVHRDTTITICKDTIIQWKGQRISQPGHYFARYTTIHGCDSVWELNFVDTVPPVRFDTTICQGSTIVYHNKLYRPSGEMRDTIVRYSRDTFGCDTFHYVHIMVDSVYGRDIDTVICGSNRFIYNGRTYTEGGTYSDTVLSVHGCPIITNLTVTFNDTVEYQTRTMCSGDSLVLSDGTVIKRSGSYNDTILQRGCNKIIHYTVNYITNNESYETRYVCDDSTPVLCSFDSSYHTVGKYDLRKPIPGTPCEYICHLNVVNLSYYHDTTVHICWQSLPYVYPLSGKTHYKQGVYYDTVPVSNWNCDSVFRLDLRVDSTHNKHESFDTVYYCHNNYSWQGMTLTRDSDYTVVYQDQYHCDSILHLHYTTTPPVYYAQLWLCPNTNQSVIFHGKHYSQPGVYHDTVYTSIGCPEILDVVVNNKISTIIIDSLFVCGPNERAIWPDNGISYGVGTYDFGYPGDTSQCKDYVHLVVTDESAAITRTVTICETKFPYTDTITGLTHYTGGVKTSYLQSRHINGCMRPYTLTIAVDQDNHYYDTYDTVCRGYNYTYLGETFRNCQNDTSIKTTTKRGLLCDSVVNFHLSVINENDTTFEQICQGMSYTWPVNGQTYTQSIIDNHTGSTYSCGCTHTDVLVLTVVNPVTVGDVNIDYVCACDTATPITITLNGVSRKPENYSIHFDATGHANGFADKLNSKLDTWDNTNKVATLSTKLPGYQSDSLSYMRPGFYNITLTFDSDVCANQTQTVSGVIEVRYPEWILKQNWDDVVAVIRKNHRDGSGNAYDFSTYSWYVNGGIVRDAHDSYLYQQGVHLTTSDYVEAELTRVGEQEAVKTCPLWIVDFDEEDGRQYPIRDPRFWRIVNRLPLQAPETSFDALESGSYSLYTITGQLIHSGTFDEDERVTVTLPAVQSYYLLRIETPSGSAVHKVLVY